MRTAATGLLYRNYLSRTEFCALAIWSLRAGCKLPGARILQGRFMAVQQSVGTARQNEAGAAFLRAFVEEAKASALVERLIQHHRILGPSAASNA
jgi:hypothetical protein